MISANNYTGNEGLQDIKYVKGNREVTISYLEGDEDSWFELVAWENGVEECFSDCIYEFDSIEDAMSQCIDWYYEAFDDEEREIEVKITLTENDLKAMEKKYGSIIKDAGDAYDCIFEAITTWLEL